MCPMGWGKVVRLLSYGSLAGGRDIRRMLIINVIVLQLKKWDRKWFATVSVLHKIQYEERLLAFITSDVSLQNELVLAWTKQNWSLSLDMFRCTISFWVHVPRSFTCFICRDVCASVRGDLIASDYQLRSIYVSRSKITCLFTRIAW